MPFLKDRRLDGILDQRVKAKNPMKNGLEMKL